MSTLENNYEDGLFFNEKVVKLLGKYGIDIDFLAQL